jgi:hypothetical protein
LKEVVSYAANDTFGDTKLVMHVLTRRKYDSDSVLVERMTKNLGVKSHKMTESNLKHDHRHEDGILKIR